MNFLYIRAYYETARKWPLTTFLMIWGGYALCYFLTPYAGMDEPSGSVWQALLALVIWIVVLWLSAAIVLPLIWRLTRWHLKLTDEDFDGVKAATGHMSFQWTIENSPKALREARKRKAE